MIYSMSNKCTKNYCNRTVLVQVIVEDVVACFFLKHGVFILGSSLFPNSFQFHLRFFQLRFHRHKADDFLVRFNACKDRKLQLY
jgi:hypothetical protein